MYPLLAKLITVKQVPAAYLILFLTCRYFIFLTLYKLWKLLSGDRFTSVCAIFMFMVLGRTEELLYRTFSHQIAGECFMFVGIYLFYKERFMLSALVLGLAANIHGIYNLFPMIFMAVYLFLFHPQRWAMVLKTGLTFTAGCLPFLLWQIPRSIHDKLAGPAVPLSEWMPLYFKSCPQNFLFFDVPIQQAWANKAFFIERVEPYAFLMVLYAFLCLVYPPLRRDKKTNVVVGTGFVLIILSTLFTYVIPSRFVLDLNLVRNEQFIRLFLMSYATFWAVETVKEGASWKAFIAALAFLFIGFGNWLYFGFQVKRFIWAIVAMAVVFIILSIRRWGNRSPI